MTNQTIAQNATAGPAGIRWPRVVGGLALALLVLSIVAAIAVPRLLGYRTYVVYGSSMEPAISVGSMTFAAPVPTEDLEVGDIIVFKSPSNGVTLTHRIVEVREEDGRRLFQTKGDASPGDDALEIDLGERAQRVVYHLPYLGYFVNFAKSPLGIVLFIVLPAAGFLALSIVGNRRTSDKEAAGAA